MTLSKSLKFNDDELLNELSKKNTKQTEDEEFSGESDSENSEDNLEEADLYYLMPKSKKSMIIV